MTILLPVLAIAFTAFCVWLVVRVVNRRERWAKRTLASTLALPVLYVASFGPACWWFTVPSGISGSAYGIPLPEAQARRVYWPIGWAATHGPSWVERLLSWYATIGGPDRRYPLFVPTDAEQDGGTWMPERP